MPEGQHMRITAVAWAFTALALLAALVAVRISERTWFLGAKQLRPARRGGAAAGVCLPRTSSSSMSN